jgi:KaiC/GvpD/RAD55 family RecA-like ATPase
MKKLKSGILGLDGILYGGVNERSISVVIGAAGTGKTTFSIQFIKKGIDSGDFGIFISLDENRRQLIEEAVAKGWTDINDYIREEKLVFLDVAGKRFAGFIRDEFPAFVNDWRGENARVVIDPLTPLIWAVENKYEQRELMSLIFKGLKEIGTSVCTLEEHYVFGGQLGHEEAIPIYLADAVIYLRHYPRISRGQPYHGTMQIIKCRNSSHSKEIHNYKILSGLGMVILDNEPQEKEQDRNIRHRLREMIETSRELPPEVARRYAEKVKGLTDRELLGVDVSYILRKIIEEER